jgi:hypothetical protein
MVQASKPSPLPVAVVAAGERASAQDRPPSASADVCACAGGKLARASQKRAQERARLLSEVNQGRPPRPASDASMPEKRAAERARLLAGIQQKGGAQGSVATAVSATPPTLSRAERYRMRAQCSRIGT